MRNGLAVRGIARDGAAALRLALLQDGGGVVLCGPVLSDMTAPILFSNLTEDFDMLVLTTGAETDMGEYQKEGLYRISLPVLSEDLAFYTSALLETRQFPGIGNPGAGTGTPSVPKDVFSEKPARTPEERRLIETAKLLLMRKERMSEAEAHRYLQKESMIKGIKMSELAGQLLRDS